jgi:hypothetical protein
LPSGGGISDATAFTSVDEPRVIAHFALYR